MQNSREKREEKSVRKNPMKLKVSEGEGRGASGVGAEIPPQSMERP